MVLGALAAVAFNVRREAIVLVVAIAVIQVVELAGSSAGAGASPSGHRCRGARSPPRTSPSPWRRS